MDMTPEAWKQKVGRTVGLHQNRKHFHHQRKVDKQQSEETTYRIEENITNTASDKGINTKVCETVTTQ